MLHIVNKSPFENRSLESCLRFAQTGSALLLTEDAVYAATVGGPSNASVHAACETLQVYALKPDTDARGVTAKVMSGVTLVDYGGFVDLAAERSAAQSWL